MNSKNQDTKNQDTKMFSLKQKEQIEAYAISSKETKETKEKGN